MAVGGGLLYPQPVYPPTRELHHLALSNLARLGGMRLYLASVVVLHLNLAVDKAILLTLPHHQASQ